MYAHKHGIGRWEFYEVYYRGHVGYRVSIGLGFGG